MKACDKEETELPMISNIEEQEERNKVHRGTRCEEDGRYHDSES